MGEGGEKEGKRRGIFNVWEDVEEKGGEEAVKGRIEEGL